MAKNEKVNKKVNETQKKPVKKNLEPEFYIYQLREHSREEFGVKPEVLDGALFRCKEVKLTKTKVKELIKAFLNKEVK